MPKTSAKSAPKPKTAPTLKSYLKELSAMIGSGALLRFALADPTAIKVSALTPTSQFFAEFPFVIEGKMDEAEDFQVPLETLLSATTSETIAQPAQIEVSESTLLVRTKRASLEIATSHATETLASAPVVEDVSMKFGLNNDFKEFLREILPVLGMEKIHEAQTDFRLAVRLSKSSVFLACYSSQQVAFVSTKNEFGIVGEFNVPYPAFTSLLKLVPPDSELQFGSDRVLATSGAFSLLTLMTPLSAKEPPGEVVHAKSKEIRASHESAGSVTIPKVDLEEFVASCKGVVPDDSPVVFSIEGTTLNLTATTTSSRAAFRIRKISSTLKEEFALELRLLKNLVSKSGESIVLHYRDGLLFAASGALGLITTTHVSR